MSGRAASPTRQVHIPDNIHDTHWIRSWLDQEKNIATIHKYYTDVIVPEYQYLDNKLPEDRVSEWFNRANNDYIAFYDQFKPGWLRTKYPNVTDIETLKGYVSKFVTRAQQLRDKYEGPFRKLAQVNRDRHDDYNERCEQCFNDIMKLRNQVHELEKQLNPTKTYKSYSIFNPNKSEGGRSKRSKRSKRVKRSKQSSTKRH